MVKRSLASVLLAAAAVAQPPRPAHSFGLLTHRMDVDVDGAPNAYGPPDKPTLDVLHDANALEGDRREIVGYVTEKDGRTPVIQGPNDPFPGYYVSQTTFQDPHNENDRDPRGYVDARSINYVVRGREAARRGVQVGDFVAAYSVRTHKAAFGIVGDTGNPTGDEGSLHLLNDLGYPFKNGKDDAVEHGEIIVRFYPRSNPKELFFFTQAELDEAAMKLGLSRDFSKSPLVLRVHPSDD